MYAESTLGRHTRYRLSDPPTRSERRANRYWHKYMNAGWSGQLWLMRSRAAYRLRLGPDALRGRSTMLLFRLLYFRE
jgi:hypothetical protein